MQKVTFSVGEETLVGHLHVPSEPAGERLPALVFTGPYTGVKEQVTGTYARRLAEAGFVTLAFDHRNFGESDGAIRQHEEPQKKLDDLAAATGFLRSRERVDPDRVGAVGICLGGSYALRFAAFDPRVKALATVAAAYLGFPPDSDEAAASKTRWLAGFADELDALGRGEPGTIAAVSDDPDAEAGMPGQEPFDYYGTERAASPHWRNRVTRLSSYGLGLFDAVRGARHLQTTPTLVVHGTNDLFCSPESARRAYDEMVGTKELRWIETTNHIELYDSDRHVGESVAHVAEWMGRHLSRRTPSRDSISAAHDSGTTKAPPSLARRRHGRRLRAAPRSSEPLDAPVGLEKMAASGDVVSRSPIAAIVAVPVAAIVAVAVAVAGAGAGAGAVAVSGAGAGAGAGADTNPREWASGTAGESFMEQIAFTMRLDPGRAEEYRARHDAIWPELVTLLREAGIRDYSIFHDPSTHVLFAVLRRTPDHGMDRLPLEPVMRRWWAHMADIMATDENDRPLTHDLEPMFHLD